MTKTIINESIIANTEQVLEAIKNDGYTEHHTSRARGYESRKKPEGRIEEYNGKFGKGYKLYKPAWDSTKYCYVTYYVKG